MASKHLRSSWITIPSLLIVASGFGFGQMTWQGLKFGWPLTQVQQVISNKGEHLVHLRNREGRSDQEQGSGPPFTVIDAAPGHEQWEVQPVFELRLSSIREPLHFRPMLMFDSNDKLERVTLVLATKQHEAEGMKAPVLLVLAAAPVQQELSKKYGAPVSKAGICEAVSTDDLVGSSRPVRCEVAWKAEEQNISLEWHYFEIGGDKTFLSMMISYKPIQASGL